MNEEQATSIWGYGLYARRWMWGHLWLRRNKLVYSIEIHLKSVLITFNFYRKKQ